MFMFFLYKRYLGFIKFSYSLDRKHINFIPLPSKVNINRLNAKCRLGFPEFLSYQLYSYSHSLL
jgi:hypothetical protein